MSSWSDEQFRAKKGILWHRIQYQSTSNPIHVWLALGWVYGAELPTSRWIEDYLRQVAINFRELSDQATIIVTKINGEEHYRYTKPPRKGTIAPAIAKALGFNSERMKRAK